jgi:hypothetical protein
MQCITDITLNLFLVTRERYAYMHTCARVIRVLQGLTSITKVT